MIHPWRDVFERSLDEFAASMIVREMLGPRAVMLEAGDLCLVATLSPCPSERPFRLMGCGPTWREAIDDVEVRAGTWRFDGW